MKTEPRPGDILQSKSGLTFRYLTFDGRFHRVRGTRSGREYPLYPAQLRALEPADAERPDTTFAQDAGGTLEAR